MLQTLDVLHRNNMDLLFGHGESVRRDVSVRVEVDAIGGFGKYRRPLCSGNINIVHHCHVGSIRLDTFTGCILEISLCCLLFERLHETERPRAKVCCHVAT